MLLKDISEITVGQIMPRVICKEGDEGEDVGVLVPKAISNGTIDLKSIKKETVKVANKNKETCTGDIVMKLSSPYDAVYISEEYSGFLVPSFCAIIKLNNINFKPKFVVAYLNSIQVKEELASKAIGTTRAMSRPLDLEQLDIPETSDANMELIGEAYELSEKKKRAMKRLIEIESNIMNKTITSIISKGED